MRHLRIEMSPILPVGLVILASLGGLLCSKAAVPLGRLIFAVSLAALIEYASVFVMSGFGWGWIDPSTTELILGRLAVGLGISISCLVFAWLACLVRPSTRILALFLLPALILMPEYGDEVPLRLLVVFAVTAYGIFRHLRAPHMPVSRHQR